MSNLDEAVATHDTLVRRYPAGLMYCQAQTERKRLQGLARSD